VVQAVRVAVPSGIKTNDFGSINTELHFFISNHINHDVFGSINTEQEYFGLGNTKHSTSIP
jgi:hypothetical protein